MDVNYLASAAQDASYIFLVDSATRDTMFDPEANKYTVRFNWPFENVTGLELLDASVARTEYIVERFENVLAFTYGGQKHAVTVPPGDYNLAQLVETLSKLVPEGFSVRAKTNPAEVSNKVEFSGEQELTIDVDNSTIRKCLGLGIKGTLVGLPTPLRKTVTLLSCPLPSANQKVAAWPPIRQRFMASTTGSPSVARLFASSPSPGALGHLEVRSMDDVIIATGTFTTGTSGFQNIQAPLTATGSVREGEEYYVQISSEDASVFVTGDDGLQGFWQDELQDYWSTGTDSVCVGLDVTPFGYAVDAPHLVDLTGDRYLCVRCPEIESRLYRDRAYEKMHVGLGMVKLGGYGVRHERFDFVSVPSRRLRTPIDKVSELTIRLERPNGALYQTKGINHSLLLAIHYRVMTKQPNVGKAPPLQPRYCPNPHEEWVHRNV